MSLFYWLDEVWAPYNSWKFVWSTFAVKQYITLKSVSAFIKFSCSWASNAVSIIKISKLNNMTMVFVKLHQTLIKSSFRCCSRFPDKCCRSYVHGRMQAMYRCCFDNVQPERWWWVSHLRLWCHLSYTISV